MIMRQRAVAAGYLATDDDDDYYNAAVTPGREVQPTVTHKTPSALDEVSGICECECDFLLFFKTKQITPSDLTCRSPARESEDA